jgi:NAD-dependent deacetylase
MSRTLSNMSVFEHQGALSMSFSSTPEHAAIELSEDIVSTLRQARNVVVLTGPELSEDSGIPAFQDGVTGLAARHYADEMTEKEAARSNRNRLWGWYEWRRATMLRAQPNAAHYAIARMEAFYPTLSVITQSVDDLQERAGSREVLYLNGRLDHARCHQCGTAHERPAEAPKVKHANCEIPPPSCSLCDGKVRPGVVWLGEEPPAEDWIQALRRINQCDLLLSVGIASPRYPAAELVHIAAARGTMVLQITPAPTALDRLANFNVRGNVGEALAALLNVLQPD